ncbi:hypothetical protein D3C75_840950 [compost metagenome]
MGQAAVKDPQGDLLDEFHIQENVDQHRGSDGDPCDLVERQTAQHPFVKQQSKGNTHSHIQRKLNHILLFRFHVDRTSCIRRFHDRIIQAEP